MEIEDIASEIERFVERAAEVDGVESNEEDEIEAATEADIEAFLQKHELTVPNDVRRFWQRGLKYRMLSVDGEQGAFASAGFDWLSLDILERDMKMFRGLAQHFEAGSDQRRLYEQGLPLSYSEPQVVLDPRGGISLAHTANRLTPPVTRSLTEFLEHWLESGCFTSHRLSLYFPKIRHLVPGRIPPEKNLWMTHYKQAYPDQA